MILGESEAVRVGMSSRPEVAGRALGGDAALGCGIGPGLGSVGGLPAAADGPSCTDLIDEWVELIETDDPEVVLLHTGATEVLDRDIDGRIVRFGGPEWDDVTRRHLAVVLDRLGSTGARVIALTAPCFAPSGEGGGPVDRGDPLRVSRWNELLREAAQQARATVIDYGAMLCPGGSYVEELEGITMRADGVHLRSEEHTSELQS